MPKSAKYSRNSLTIEQVRIACRHVDELMEAGCTENYAIRTLELFTDNYAKVLSGSAPSPHAASKIDQQFWSDEAIRAAEDLQPKDYGQRLRVEHGTPRRTFARMVLKAFHDGDLKQERLDELCRTWWQLA